MIAVVEREKNTYLKYMLTLFVAIITMIIESMTGFLNGQHDDFAYVGTPNDCDDSSDEENFDWVDEEPIDDHIKSDSYSNDPSSNEESNDDDIYERNQYSFQVNQGDYGLEEYLQRKRRETTNPGQELEDMFPDSTITRFG